MEYELRFLYLHLKKQRNRELDSIICDAHSSRWRLMGGHGWCSGRGGTGLSFLRLGILKQEWPVGNGWSKCIAADISNKETQVTGKSRLPDILELFPFSAPQLQGTVGQQNPSLPEEMKNGDTYMCARVCAWACAHTHAWNYGHVCVCTYVCVRTHLCPIDVLISIVKYW